MPETKIKICGLTNEADACRAAELGADFLGFIFYPKSPRFIEPEQLAEFIGNIPGNALKVGVFVNESAEEMLRIVEQCGLNVIQLHGNETPDFATCMKSEAGAETAIWKALPLKDESDLNYAQSFPADKVLVDYMDETAYGGTGKCADWKLARNLSDSREIVLAGGLNPDNAAEAVRRVQPYTVDVCSGVEAGPGKKDHEKMRRFFEALNRI